MSNFFDEIDISNILHFVSQNETNILHSFYAISIGNLVLDVLKLRKQNPNAPLLQQLLVFVLGGAASLALTHYLFYTFPTSNLVLAVQAIFSLNKINNWTNFVGESPKNCTGQLVTSYVKNVVLGLFGWLNLLPTMANHMILLFMWQWLRNGARIHVPRFHNYSPLENNAVNLVVELSAFIINFIDLLVYLKNQATSFRSKRGFFKKTFLIGAFLLSATFLSPPIRLVHRRLTEEALI